MSALRLFEPQLQVTRPTQKTYEIDENQLSLSLEISWPQETFQMYENLSDNE